ncbi:TonB-dependent hemoglobin/transferrin/lactoferrin family receptor [Campylobacter curvus]|uniref:TonB-dependent hemoglobin/transferrin/lactoferrin family receptor n=1 Tax=Campylobacter curvus TaxID=200 RepID=UPI0014703075|nr:TonB-dependent hemoglobin/transferrin/lactoferrin family receptor [Campylobacter curvus]
MSGNRLKLSLIALLVLNGGGLFAADEKDVKLDSIEVIGTMPDDDVKTKKVGETKKSAKTLEQQQVQDTRDLVKYETGITVVETGRMGASGYSVRGVDENRVAISIDGLQQAETLSSQGFKELFEGYGNFNNTRNGVEIENIRQATITKGADSIKTGSGALGGSVMFETKDARDYLVDKDYFYSGKRGYSSADNQNWQSHTLAGRIKWFDFLLVRTNREGNELENYGYKHYDDSVIRKEREKADPYRIHKNSTLLKMSFQPNETNRFTLSYDNSKTVSKGTDLSNSFTSFQTFPPIYLPNVRHTDDRSERKNISFVYENFDETPLWDSLKISYNKQNIKLKARTDEYCDGDNCEEIANPNGLHLNENGKLVDKYGGEVKTWMKWGFMPTLVDSQFDTSDTDPDSPKNQAQKDHIIDMDKYRDYGPNDDVYVNCNEYDCSKGMTLFDTDSNTYKTYTLQRITTPHSDGNYAKFSPVGSDRLLLPYEKGYVENQWKDRDLKTDTKQLNLDLTKEFTTKGIEHTLSYGGLYSKSEKSMVNKAGYSAHSKQWWAKYFSGARNTNPAFPMLGTWYPDKCKPYNDDTAYANMCGHEDDPFSFLIPVTTKTGALYLGDNINVNDYISFDLNYRYDKVNLDPKYIPGVTPKIPTDLFIGLFVPYTPLPGSPSPDEIKAHRVANAEANAVYLASQKRKYSAKSYSLSTNIDPLDFLRVQLKYSNGFRAPTSDEVYFTFQHPDFSIFPNIDLKEETAKTKEVAFTLYNSPSFITLNIFQTDYKNFIDLAYKGQRELPYGNSGSRLKADTYQNVNRSKAKVKGFEVNSKLFLDQVWQPLRGFNIGYKITIQKGRMSIDDSNNLDTPMNAIQPRTTVYTVGYQSPGDKFGADFYLTSVAAKKASDTYNMYWKEEGKSNSYVKWRSDDYTVMDLTAYYKPIKNLIFRAGVYNIQDRKYLTWENARSIRPFGTSNLINQDTGKGIARFYSPGRNFKLSFELTF